MIKPAQQRCVLSSSFLSLWRSYLSSGIKMFISPCTSIKNSYKGWGFWHAVNHTRGKYSIVFFWTYGYAAKNINHYTTIPRVHMRQTMVHKLLQTHMSSRWLLGSDKMPPKYKSLAAKTNCCRTLTDAHIALFINSNMHSVHWPVVSRPAVWGHYLAATNSNIYALCDVHSLLHLTENQLQINLIHEWDSKLNLK